ncbi:DUF533 domain-containing protein [Dankookia sp. P2]|uniref:DUF533 domain-containing protein n=1 Tax=Dankookia sp. P2 TaxID=3423955 RepID=UPI003D67F036
MLLVWAMIQAKADGQIAAEGMARTMDRLAEAGEARQVVRRAMRQPADIAGLAAEAGDPRAAAGLYAASLMAVTADSQGERDKRRGHRPRRWRMSGRGWQRGPPPPPHPGGATSRASSGSPPTDSRWA